jgi:hypothetical protein
VYIVKAVHDLDLTGGTFAYTVRRLRGGVEWGATRVIGECGLTDLKQCAMDWIRGAP